MTTTKLEFNNPIDIKTALSENRGRPPATIAAQELKTTKRVWAWQALKRIKRIATDNNIFTAHPRLSFEANQWLYEIEHGKPAIQVDQRVTGRIVISPDDLTIIDAIQDNDQSLLTTSYSVVDDDPPADSTLQNVDVQTQVDNNNNDDETL